MAVCRFRAGHNRFPSNPSELVPDFIAAVPQDPFDGKPLRMKKAAGKLIVYSIGPDAIDNGGAPFDRQKRTGDIPFTIRQWAAPAAGRRQRKTPSTAESPPGGGQSSAPLGQAQRGQPRSGT